jgi:hypothetical protein
MAAGDRDRENFRAIELSATKLQLPSPDRMAGHEKLGLEHQ